MKNYLLSIMSKKICSKCGEEKDLSEFNFRKDSIDGYYRNCKDCRKKYSKKYRTNHSDYLISYRKKYRLLNYEVVLEKNRNYHRNNREKYNRWRNEKYKNDFLFKLSTNIRNRLNVIINLKSIKKNQKTFEIIGCTIEELKIHLEKQFSDGMTWENHEQFGWHIDHIIPLDSATTKEELYKLCHYTNLRPLWWEDNLHKSYKIA